MAQNRHMYCTDDCTVDCGSCKGVTLPKLTETAQKFADRRELATGTPDTFDVGYGHAVVDVLDYMTMGRITPALRLILKEIR